MVRSSKTVTNCRLNCPYRIPCPPDAGTIRLLFFKIVPNWPVGRKGLWGPRAGLWQAIGAPLYWHNPYSGPPSRASRPQGPPSPRKAPHTCFAHTLNCHLSALSLYWQYPYSGPPSRASRPQRPALAPEGPPYVFCPYNDTPTARQQPALAPSPVATTSPISWQRCQSVALSSLRTPPSHSDRKSMRPCAHHFSWRSPGCQRVGSPSGFR